jgi:hypothetical protein
MMNQLCLHILLHVIGVRHFYKMVNWQYNSMCVSLFFYCHMELGLKHVR